MGNEIVVRSFSENEIETIKSSIAVGVSKSELDLFLSVCKRTGLDPFSRQIYCKASGSGSDRKFSIQATIDGFRVVAERSGKYRGQVGPQWCGDDGVWRDVWLDKKNPTAARVGVLRSDFQEPLFAIAKFDSYAQRNFKGELNFTWAKMPDLMIAKCAEALALRKAFPNDLSGLYEATEMQQAEVDAKPVYSGDVELETIPQPSSRGRMPSTTKELVEPVKIDFKNLDHIEEKIDLVNAELQSASETPFSLSPSDMDLAQDIAKSKSKSGNRMSVSNLIDGMHKVKKAKEQSEKSVPEINSEAANYKITFGKNYGKTLKEVPSNWLRFMIDEWYPGLQKPSESITEFYKAGCEYLNQKNGAPILPPAQGQNDELPF